MECKIGSVLAENRPLPSAECCYDGLERDGFVQLDGILSQDFVESCQAYVRSQLDAYGNRYFTITDVDGREDAPFRALMQLPEVDLLMRKLVEMGGGPEALTKFHNGNNLRVIQGKGSAAKSQSMKFHYDSDVLTMLVPVFIPDGAPQEAGDLILYPNRRRFGRSALLNVIRKAVEQNRFSWRLFSKRVLLGHAEAKIVRLKPGSICLFWGYRSLHANFACRSDSVRATALYFFGDPHPGDRLIGAVTRSRLQREAAILNGHVA